MSPLRAMIGCCAVRGLFLCARAVCSIRSTGSRPARPGLPVPHRGSPLGRSSIESPAMAPLGRKNWIGLRHLSEQFSHRYVARRHLPPPFKPIPFYVSSEGGLKYLRRSVAHVDRELLALVAEFVQRDSVVWDIGANVGLFSFAAAAASGPKGQVIAVEPDSWLVDLLRRSSALDGDRAPVVVVPVAVSDQSGFATFHIASRSRATNYLDGYGSPDSGGSRDRQVVPTIDIDSLGRHFPWPDILKIDVEGAELLALTGAKDALAHRPVLICEVTKANSAEVTALLHAAGYRLFDGLCPAAARGEVDMATFQTLAQPDPSWPSATTCSQQ